MRSTACPLRKTTIVGILMTEKLLGTSWFSSTFILAKVTLPAYSAANCSITGPTILHGPHQGAQKSTTKSGFDFRVSWKLESVMVSGRAFTCWCSAWFSIAWIFLCFICCNSLSSNVGVSPLRVFMLAFLLPLVVSKRCRKERGHTSLRVCLVGIQIFSPLPLHLDSIMWLPTKYMLRYCHYRAILFILVKTQCIPMESINQLTKKGATCTDLLTCLYNLKPADIEILQAVLTGPGANIDQIAAHIGKDRSSVHRCLSKLVSINLVNKQTKSLKGGGYYHTYRMLDSGLIKKHARERVKEITESLQALIESFDSDLEKHLTQS